ncbi:MAG: tRNA1(Val) (adenine(37)-N6)-methyltransferase [Desulfonatronovibrio sp.]
MTEYGRKYPGGFPRGLSQPETGFRFSADSLLLSCFVKPGHGHKVVDLGCGCGVIGFGVMLASPEKDIWVTGLDKNPEMIDHSVRNAESLGLSSCFQALEMDLSQVKSTCFKPESYDLAVANPPYRKPGAGRAPRDKSRLQASVGDIDQLEQFCKAGAFLLKKKGKLGVVFLADRIDELLMIMNRSGLIPKKILPVYGNRTRPARVILIEAVKNAGPGLTIMPPLFLYDQTNRLTSQALKFCPFLECNPDRSD